MKKKILSIFLVLCMACTLLPLSAFAADVIDSGTCGDGVFWSLDALGSLTVSGEGAMEDYAAASDAPWYGRQSSIRAVAIGDGVTSIGDHAFSGNYESTAYRSFKSLTVGDSVESIGDFAFYSCVFLENVDLGNGVKTIGEAAFSRCAFESIALPEGLQTVSDGLFRGCYKLKNATLPDSVKAIGERAFTECPRLESFAMGNGVESIGNAAFYGDNKMTALTFGSSLKTIGDQAFIGCSGLTELTLPSGLETIGREAFMECDALESVVIPEGVRSIGDSAFAGDEALKSVVIPASVQSIGAEAFYSCTALEDLTIPDSIDSIGGGAFTYCYKLADENGYVTVNNMLYGYTGSEADVIIPDGVVRIGVNAFRDSRTLKSIVIPASVEIIEFAAFTKCPALETVYYTGTRAQWSNIVIVGGEFVGNDEVLTSNGDLLDAFRHYNWVADGTHYTAVVKAPTCTSEGYTTYTCECGDSYVGDYTPVTDHHFRNGRCTVCGAEDPDYTPDIVTQIINSITNAFTQVINTITNFFRSIFRF